MTTTTAPTTLTWAYSGYSHNLYADGVYVASLTLTSDAKGLRATWDGDGYIGSYSAREVTFAKSEVERIFRDADALYGDAEIHDPAHDDPAYWAYLEGLDADHKRETERAGQDAPMAWGTEMEPQDGEKGYFCETCWRTGDETGFHAYAIPPCDPISKWTM